MTARNQTNAHWFSVLIAVLFLGYWVSYWPMPTFRNEYSKYPTITAAWQYLNRKHAMLGCHPSTRGWRWCHVTSGSTIGACYHFRYVNANDVGAITEVLWRHMRMNRSMITWEECAEPSWPRERANDVTRARTTRRHSALHCTLGHLDVRVVSRLHRLTCKRALFGSFYIGYKSYPNAKCWMRLVREERQVNDANDWGVRSTSRRYWRHRVNSNEPIERSCLIAQQSDVAKQRTVSQCVFRELQHYLWVSDKQWQMLNNLN